MMFAITIWPKTGHHLVQAQLEIEACLPKPFTVYAPKIDIVTLDNVTLLPQQHMNIVFTKNDSCNDVDHTNNGVSNGHSAKRKIAVSNIEVQNKRHRTVNHSKARNRTNELVQECVEDILEWMGMLTIGSDSVMGETLDPFISTYRVPKSIDQMKSTGQYIRIRITGFLCHHAIQHVFRLAIACTQSTISSECSVNGVVVHGIEDVVIKTWRANHSLEKRKKSSIPRVTYQVKRMRGEQTLTLVWLTTSLQSDTMILSMESEERG